MCVVSMIMDHYGDRWERRVRPIVPPEITYWPPVISPEEVAEFRELLERAREYDKKNNEPDCELRTKRDRLQKLADELGVDISFV